MFERRLNVLSRRLLLGAVLLGAAGCMARGPIDAPPKSPIFFTPFSASLDDNANRVINEVAADALANPSHTVIVEGFADSVGTPSSNKTLSQLRAQVVADALVAHGVAQNRIVLHPRGATAADPGIESRRVDVSYGR